jgi:hypothetical protein
MLTEDAHTPASEHLGEKHAGFNGNPPKMLTSEGVSALGDGERLGDTPGPDTRPDPEPFVENREP